MAYKKRVFFFYAILVLWIKLQLNILLVLLPSMFDEFIFLILAPFLCFLMVLSTIKGCNFDDFLGLLLYCCMDKGKLSKQYTKKWIGVSLCFHEWFKSSETSNYIISSRFSVYVFLLFASISYYCIVVFF